MDSVGGPGPAAFACADYAYWRHDEIMTSTPVSKQWGTRKTGWGTEEELVAKLGIEPFSGNTTTGSWKRNRSLAGALIVVILVSGRVFALLCFAFFSPRYLVIYPYSPSVGRFMEILVWSRGAMNTTAYLANTTTTQDKKKRKYCRLCVAVGGVVVICQVAP